MSKMYEKYHQNLEQIINSADPATRVIWEQVLLLVGENAAVRQFYFAGPVAGSEFLTYTLGTIYLALDCEAGIPTAGTVGAGGLVTFYDQLNVINFAGENNSPAWDTTGAVMEYSLNNYRNENIFFGRVAMSVFSYFKFIGYKIVF